MIEIKNRWTGAVIRTVDAADLSGANLRGADLSGANLRGLMTKEQRKDIRAKIIAAANEMTADKSNRDSVVVVGQHKIERRLVYAGGSQWGGCGRDWDSTEQGWAWVVDGEYRLTTPDLFGFDGRNMIEVQTPYYIADGYDEQSAPEHDGRTPADKVPNRILLEIAKGLVAALKQKEDDSAREEAEAEQVLEALSA